MGDGKNQNLQYIFHIPNLRTVTRTDIHRLILCTQNQSPYNLVE